VEEEEEEIAKQLMGKKVNTLVPIKSQNE